MARFAAIEYTFAPISVALGALFVGFLPIIAAMLLVFLHFFFSLGLLLPDQVPPRGLPFSGLFAYTEQILRREGLYQSLRRFLGK